MNRRVRLRNDERENEDVSPDVDGGIEEDSSTPETDVESDEESTSSASGSDTDNRSDSASDVSEDPTRPKESSKDISFGALAEAQAAFPPKSRKRKAPPDFDNDENRQEHKDDKVVTQNTFRKDTQPKPHRQSKHAPTMLSSTQQVSRKRVIFEPSPASKARDPRFDPTIQASNHDRNAVEKSNRNYSFLTTYQAAEILELKAQVKKTKDPVAVAELKRKVMSIESKLKNAEAKQRERDIVQQHKKKEKAAIASGEKEKPYFLKESDVKKIAKQERVEGMSKRAQDKAAARKQKREKTKDARDMPRVRRE